MNINKIIQLYNKQNQINKQKELNKKYFVNNFNKLNNILKNNKYIDFLINNLNINKYEKLNNYNKKQIKKIIKNKNKNKIIFIDNKLYKINKKLKKYFSIIQGNNKNKYYNNLAKNNIFNYLNLSFNENTNLIKISKNSTIKDPIELYYFYTNNNLYNTRNIIIINNNSVKIIEKQYSLNKNIRLLNNIINEIFINKNSKLEYYKIQNDNKKNIIIDNTFIKQNNNTTCEIYSFTFKNKIIFNNLHIRQTGSNSNSIIKNCTLPKTSKQIIYHNTIVKHEKSIGYSKEIYKSIIKKKINFFFLGKIIINKNINKINAIQKNNNMILCKKSNVNTKPELDIFSKDVKCSHGCTISKFNQQIIFYMQTRGLNKLTCEKLLIQGFFKDITKNITINFLKKEIEKNI